MEGLLHFFDDLGLVFDVRDEFVVSKDELEEARGRFRGRVLFEELEEGRRLFGVNHRMIWLNSCAYLIIR